MEPEPWPKKRWRCPHCRSSQDCPVACVTCNRDMCGECISYGDAGKVCGMCKDREDGWHRWRLLRQTGKTVLNFDEWYDKNA